MWSPPQVVSTLIDLSGQELLQISILHCTTLDFVRIALHCSVAVFVGIMALQSWKFVCLTLLFMLSSATGNSDPQDVKYLNDVKSKWQNTPPTWKGFDPCGGLWDGVRCNNSSRIVSLTLSSMNLSGTLATQIGSLTRLKILDLSYNKLLIGPIPTTLGNLANLQILVLIGCSFTGNIPHELGNLLALTFLDLSSNSLNGSIPPSVGNLSELSVLDLSNNQLSGSLPVSSLNGSGLDRLIKTQHFHLNQNQFSGPIAPDIFHSNMLLIHLLLDSNCLVGNIPSTVGDVQALQVIRLDRNFLEGPIPSNIGKIENLTVLHLSNNKLSGTIPDFSGLNRLQYIDLSNNSFDGSSEALKFFIALEQLTTLVIEKGHLTGTVPPALFRLPQLETVKLGYNSLNGTLQIDSNTSPHLQLIDVQNNQITNLNSAENTNNPTLFCRLNLKGNPALENPSLPEKANSCLSGSPKNPIYPATCENPETSGIEGKLVFRAPSFSDLRNESRLDLLKNSLSSRLNLNVSFCDVSFDSKSYLNIILRLSPWNEGANFDRSVILNISSALSQKYYMAPTEFGSFYFVEFTASPYFRGSMASKGFRRNAIYGIAFGALSLSLVIAGVAAYAIIQKRRADKARMMYRPFASWRRTVPIGAPKIKGVRSFTFLELKKCTHYFSEDYKIGSGGYGTVYKGVLPGGNEMVAIKRAKSGSMQGAAEFKNEIEVLSRVHHKNLVALIGFCFDQGEQMLAYEYMPNGSLSQNLYGQSGTRNFLDWRKRVRIAVGAARGLAYLHEHANPPIIHRDVKSSNILLDENLNAKVADFGLSKLAAYAEENVDVSMKLKGTLGYMDPEYYMTLQLSEKTDVYSLGVVLLEILTGKQAIEEGRNIVKWVEGILKQEKGDVRALIDPTLGAGSGADVKSYKSFLNLALHCVEEWGINRPNTSAVVKELESILNDVEETALPHQIKDYTDKVI